MSLQLNIKFHLNLSNIRIYFYVDITIFEYIILIILFYITIWHFLCQIS